MRLSLAIACVLALAIGSRPAASTDYDTMSRACSWASRTWVTGSPHLAILAVATDEWVERVRIDLPFYEPYEAPPPPAPGSSELVILPSPHRPADDAIYLAQRFVAGELGAGSAAKLRAGDGFLVVPLSYAMDCTTTPWPRREWIPAGDTVVFMFDSDDAGEDASGEPIYQRMAFRGPHPGSVEAQWALRRSDVPRKELSAREFFRYLHALPSVELVESQPRQALADLEAWVERNVDELAYPVAESLAHLRELVAERRPSI